MKGSRHSKAFFRQPVKASCLRHGRRSLAPAAQMAIATDPQSSESGAHSNLPRV